MADREFPELQHTKHQPSTGDAEPAYLRSSVSVGCGHEDHPERMPHPFHQTPPNSESGEGQG